MTGSERYARTEAGRAEITAPSVKLPRPARNLLLVMDASRTAEDWVSKVLGSSMADIAILIDAKLIAPAAVSATGQSSPRIPVEVAVRGLAYDTLYKLLTQEAKERFGLIKGYRLILKIEGCSGLEELQAVALDFVDQIRKAHGEESAARFRKLLGATD